MKLVTDMEKSVTEFRSEHNESLILYLSNKARFHDIGVGGLYDAYSKVQKYSFGKNIVQLIF